MRSFVLLPIGKEAHRVGALNVLADDARMIKPVVGKQEMSR